jgi:DNA ligase-associated metallophosphoesterase
VADLHLEKASFFARHGQMLPPYDSREALERVAAAIRQCGARRVFCLGDNFHDAEGAARLEPHAAGMLDALTRATDWVWIAGNHDQGKAPQGTVVEDIEVSGLMLRHEALQGEPRPELSGHFHPKLRVTACGRSISRPCAVRSERKLILPAFGTLTGGLDATDPAIIAALDPKRSADALLGVQGRLVQYPIWRAAA